MEMRRNVEYLSNCLQKCRLGVLQCTTDLELRVVNGVSTNLNKLPHGSCFYYRKSQDFFRFQPSHGIVNSWVLSTAPKEQQQQLEQEQEQQEQQQQLLLQHRRD
jgi:hypothetical protein